MSSICRCPLMPEERIGSAGVNSRLLWASCGCWEVILCPWKKQQILLTQETASWRPLPFAFNFQDVEVFYSWRPLILPSSWNRTQNLPMLSTSGHSLLLVNTTQTIQLQRSSFNKQTLILAISKVNTIKTWVWTAVIMSWTGDLAHRYYNRN